MSTKIGKILYSLALRKTKPSEENSELKVYAVAQSRTTVDIEALSKHMAEHGSPFSVGTITGILTDAVDHIAELLHDGRRVELGSLGTIYVSLKSQGVTDAESFNAGEHIKKVLPRMQFTQGMVHAMNTDVEFEYTTSRKVQGETKKQAKQALNEVMAASTSGEGD